MRIAVFIPDLPLDADVFTTCGSEFRWALNWMYLLREQGHDVVRVHDTFSSSEVFDLYLHTVRSIHTACDAGNVLSKRHAHLAFGLPHQEYVDGFGCRCRFPGALVFPNWETMEVSGTSVQKYGYRRFLLPTPYPRNLRPVSINSGFERNEIIWMLKRVWAHRPLNSHEMAVDSYVDVAIWTLEAIRDLSHKHELVFNYVKENFYGWGMEPMPPAAQKVLESIRGLNYVENLDFKDVLRYMAQSKLSISIAGLTGSALESVFCGCVPLGYTNPITTNEHFLIPTTLTYEASKQGLTLPLITSTSKADIVDKLEQLWEDEDAYQSSQRAYQKAFQTHQEENCLQDFADMLENHVAN